MGLNYLKEKVKEIAEGRYHTVEKTITEFHDGEARERYRGYTDNLAWTKYYETPDEVIFELNQAKKEEAKEKENENSDNLPF